MDCNLCTLGPAYSEQKRYKGNCSSQTELLDFTENDFDAMRFIHCFGELVGTEFILRVELYWSERESDIAWNGYIDFSVVCLH